MRREWECMECNGQGAWASREQCAHRQTVFGTAQQGQPSQPSMHRSRPWQGGGSQRAPWRGEQHEHTQGGHREHACREGGSAARSWHTLP